MPTAVAPATTGGATETDALIIGAGPVGIYQAFELGLLNIQSHIVDVLPQAGGQCIELYPEKPIYDIPGLPRCTGRELTERLMQQVAPFKPHWHLGQLVTTLVRQSDGRWLVETNQHQRFVTKTLFIAAGVGAFSPKLLKLEGLDQLDPAHAQQQVRYSAGNLADYAGRHVLIVGDGDTALQTALALATDAPASVTVVYRRDVFSAEAVTVAAFRSAVAQERVGLHIGQPVGLQQIQGRLTHLLVTDPQAQTQALPCDTVLVLQGLSPKLGPLADWGLALERKQLPVDTEQFSTAEPGIFAVGDVNIYPGKKKLIVCGFHEATLAAFGAAAIVFPGQKIALQYTTSSTQLQSLLGVGADASAG